MNSSSIGDVGMFNIHRPHSSGLYPSNFESRRPINPGRHHREDAMPNAFALEHRVSSAELTMRSTPRCALTAEAHADAVRPGKMEPSNSLPSSVKSCPLKPFVEVHITALHCSIVTELAEYIVAATFA